LHVLVEQKGNQEREWVRVDEVVGGIVPGHGKCAIHVGRSYGSRGWGPAPTHRADMPME
jgi:hypothetical protein